MKIFKKYWIWILIGISVLFLAVGALGIALTISTNSSTEETEEVEYVYLDPIENPKTGIIIDDPVRKEN